MIQKLSNSELLDQTKKLALEERKLNIEILKHLKEIEARKLFLEMGYRSLFEYTVKELSYSEDAAYRRINAMRLLKDVPQVEAKIESGSLSLTAACKVQQFLRAEVIQNKPIVNKIELIESLENKSTREVEKELLKLNPEIIPTEKLRPLTEDKMELRLVIDEGLKQKLDQSKNLLSHVNPNMTYQELISYLAEVGLKKIDPAQKVVRSRQKLLPSQSIVNSAQPIFQHSNSVSQKLSNNLPQQISKLNYKVNSSSAKIFDYKSNSSSAITSNLKTSVKLRGSLSQPSKNSEQNSNPQRNVSGAEKWANDLAPILNNFTLHKNVQLHKESKPIHQSQMKSKSVQKSRYISSAIKYTVWMRDGGQCTFTDKLTGRRCSANKRLQYDHIEPFSLGGSTSVNNLRLLCQQHNQLRADKTFGKYKRSF